MAEYLSPGVYVEEYDSGAVPMQGVSTNTAGFLGMAERGPVTGAPQLVTSLADYRRIYGGFLSAARYGEGRFLPYGVEQFFMNGGSRAFIERVAPANAAAASAKAGILTVSASNPGEWGNKLKVIVRPCSKGRTQVLAKNGAELTLKNADGFAEGDTVELFDGRAYATATIKAAQDKVITLDAPCELDIVDAKVGTEKYIKTCEVSILVRMDDMEEEYVNLSLNSQQINFAETKTAKSDLVVLKVDKDAKVEQKKSGSKKSAPKSDNPFGFGEDGVEEAVAVVPADNDGTPTPFALVGGSGDELVLSLDGGSDGSALTVTPDVYLGVDDGPGRRTGLQAFIEVPEMSIVAIPGVVMPEVQAALIAFCENQKSCFAVLDMPRDLKKTGDLANFRNMYDTTYAAIYHPWLEMFDNQAKRGDYFPPSGAMVGIYARTDNERGVHKAPANEIVRGCTGLSCAYNQGEQDMLNPIGVNLIRAFTGRGIRVWGARTMSSNGLWKYLNVRRLFIYVEQSIKNNTNWVVFEPNSEALWGRVTRTIELFLATCWRDGALAGTTPSEAFYVECGHTTMTQDDIDNGRLICQIGIAPVKPAEFVIFRITQKTASSAE